MQSRYPKRFEDDGTDVTIDLHGCTVKEAVYAIRRTVQEAHRYGRARVVVIHGKSSGGESASKQTIKGELERMLDGGELSTWISGTMGDSAGGRSTLWIHIGPKRNAARIKLRDVVRG